jgi:hypothetical protein
MTALLIIWIYVVIGVLVGIRKENSYKENLTKKWPSKREKGAKLE